jgi:hypothetical protein
MFWDRATIRGNDVLGAVIDTDLVRCSILVPIVSPSYVNFERSDWCRRELETFCSAAEKAGGVRIGEQSRIFKVMKTFVPLEQQPDPLKDLLGYEFYRKDPDSGRPREFFLQPTAIDPEYIQKIDDLASDIRDFLKLVTERASRTASDGSSPGSPTLYLAETTGDLAAERERVLRTLRQRGYTVQPGKPLPVAHGASLRKYVDECLEQAALSIHLVGANYGAIPEAETESIVFIQNELAARRNAERGIARIVWIPAGVNPADERQRAFLERLRTDSDAQRGAEILSCSLEELETVVQDALKRKARAGAAGQPGRDAASNLKYVYLICDRRDLEAAQVLRDVLYACDSRIEVNLPLFEGDEADVRALHREYLSTCDAVLLYVGAAAESWVEMKKLDLRKMDGFGRSRPALCKAVYLGPPASPAKERFQTREALVLRSVEQPSAATLLPLLGQLGLTQAT